MTAVADREDAPPGGPASGKPGRQSRGLHAALTVVRLGPVLLLLIIMAVMAALNPLFLSPFNLGNVGLEASVVAILALGQLLVIVTAGIDLSVGSVIAMSSILGALWIRELDLVSGWLVIPSMILAGGLAGAVNGTLFVKGRLPHPFLPTLAMLMVARGVALIVSDGQPITGMPESIKLFGSGRIGHVPYAVILVAALAVIVYVLLRRITWGQWIYAIGGNREAARRVGVPVDRVLISVYVFSGMCAGTAAIVVSGQTNSAYPTAGNLMELSAIAAVIIGGASFFGGRGTVIGTLVGALILGVIQNGLNLMNVQSSWQYVALGAAVVIAVELDVVRARLETRLRVVRTEETEARA
ncbi:ABC transporter permease [Georgenia wutianyii]|uniref:ABC transporter permease n=1 Tax=Georgenia wutianyii TaxID=2585135 RepID=A0ABX5VN87_9MICO|nr:ABC transporter permease [Georgenia wutianyii]QDB79668.1 ABC transporter permease [Georgenia wutianyii]